MKKTWQCSYCYFSNDEELVVGAHESNCQHNPDNEECTTCRDKNRECNNSQGCDKWVRER